MTTPFARAAAAAVFASVLGLAGTAQAQTSGARSGGLLDDLFGDFHTDVLAERFVGIERGGGGWPYDEQQDGTNRRSELGGRHPISSPSEGAGRRRSGRA